jgi:hypothetical protein
MIVSGLSLVFGAALHAQEVVSDSTKGEPVSESTEAAASAPAAKSLTFSCDPSLGITMESISRDGEESFTGQWLAGLQSKLFIDGERFQLNSSIYAKYGQLHSADAIPEKTTDDLILSITPSMTVLPVIGIGLFLEVTGETQFARGIVDSSVTRFADPLFLYQSLFLGKRFVWASEDGTGSFDLTAGIGYALQQTFADKFVLEQNRQFVVTENSPLSDVQSQVTLESGYSGIVDLNYRTALTTDLTLKAGWKTVALTRPDFTSDIKDARVTSLLLVGVQYSYFSLDYSGHLVYDRNIALRRSLNQSLVFGLRVSL